MSKVVIPLFVAEAIEDAKKQYKGNEVDWQMYRVVNGGSSQFETWIRTKGNLQVLAKAIEEGYSLDLPEVPFSEAFEDMVKNGTVYQLGTIGGGEYKMLGNKMHFNDPMTGWRETYNDFSFFLNKTFKKVVK